MRRKTARPVSPVRCIECGGVAELSNSQKVYPYAPRFWNRMVWLCPCGAYVGCHPGTEIALGYPAGPETRHARMQAHAAFDPLWRRKAAKEGIGMNKARKSGYKWLAETLGIDPKQCHISMMDAATAGRVVELCSRFAKERK